MKNLRAKEIMESAEDIEVLYQGYPVWIEQIKNMNTVEITILATNDKKDVPVADLTENELL